MIIGVPKEIQDNEYRVALVPEGARALKARGHCVLVERSAGEGSGFPDAAYRKAGAEIVRSAALLFRKADLITKVKQPEPSELELFRPGQILFAYVHAENRPWLLDGLMKRRVSAVAYEEMMLDDGRRPLLTPMSQIAGHMAVLIGCQFLQRHRGGMGVMIGQVAGAPAPIVVILGGGSAGTRAAQAAAGLGADVFVYEAWAERRQQLKKLLPASVKVLAPDKRDLAARLGETVLLINTTDVPEKTKAPLVTRAMVRRMPQGAVIVDVTANVRGAIETSLRQTSHSAPVFEEEGVLHYVVPNIPGSVPRTATLALTSATFPYLRTIADQGLAKSLLKDAALCRGLVCHAGWCTSKMLAELHGKEWRPAQEALASAGARK